MTEKRFTKVSMSEDLIELNDNGKYIVLNDIGLENLLNELNNKNELLKEENKELRQDNDIKFWKMQCIESSNDNQIMLFELGRAMQQGYGLSDKFKQYLEKVKEHDEKIREKHKRFV